MALYLLILIRKCFIYFGGKNEKFLFILLFCLWAGLLYGQTITVTGPTGGSFSQADTLTIIWSVTEIIENVMINLRKSDGSGGTTLQESYSAASSPYRHPLTDIAPGDYFIKIKQGLVSGQSPVKRINKFLDLKKNTLTEIEICSLTHFENGRARTLSCMIDSNLKITVDLRPKLINESNV